MSKYWPIVFWMYDHAGGILKYKPSFVHADHVRWCFLETDALAYGLRQLYEDNSVVRNNLEGMPTFIVKVIKSETKPDISEASTLRLFVERIPLQSRDD